ncbi:uroporphyrinogen decarboxylase [Iris pallida]|uniref:Uroporphyrinogen decarboxylase n=1 Tax=Iris pallida TaxID=29817 RepID=A0AAX6HTY3_IRIPA|nr:uroporphyrinogen decarboxylase [Iris pallida]
MKLLFWDLLGLRSVYVGILCCRRWFVKAFLKDKEYGILTTKGFACVVAEVHRLHAEYIKNQADNGDQAVQIFDSWATELSPVDFEEFSLPHI